MTSQQENLKSSSLSPDQMPYFGPHRRWYEQLVELSYTILPLAREEQKKHDLKMGRSSAETLIPAVVLEEARQLETADEVFGFLKAAVPEGICEVLENQDLSWLLEFASTDESLLSPLIVEAIHCSVDRVTKYEAWEGRRVGNIFYNYIEALEVIYLASQGKGVAAEELESAKVYRDEVEIFCNALFGQDLLLIRTILARKCPEAFLNRWETVDEDGEIALKPTLGAREKTE